jgi:hypothetical protein
MDINMAKWTPRINIRRGEDAALWVRTRRDRVALGARRMIQRALVLYWPSMNPHRIANCQSSLVSQPIRLSGRSENIEPIIERVRSLGITIALLMSLFLKLPAQPPASSAYLAAWGAICLSIITTSSFYPFDAIERPSQYLILSNVQKIPSVTPYPGYRRLSIQLTLFWIFVHFRILE